MYSYYAIAYRFGNLNGEVIHLGGSNDLDLMLQKSKDYVDYRGGKYGVAVWKHEGFAEYGEIVAYFPSMNGEDSPEYNERFETAKSIGYAVISAAETGKTWVLNPDEGDGRMLCISAQLPDWLQQEVARILEREAIITDITTASSTKRNSY